MTKLKIIDAEANNLTDFSIELPLKQFVTVTGPSGSGKTTLLRDVIYAEWRRRITNDSLSSTQLICGLPPVFYFGSQRPPRSKEIVLEGIGAASYLTELSLRIGTACCVVCQSAINYESLEQLYSRLSKLIGSTIVVGVPLNQDEILNIGTESDLRVIFENKVVRYQALEQDQISSSSVRALDLIKISNLSRGRLLELLTLAQQLSNSKIFVLNNDQLETIFLVPTCSVCGNQQRAIERNLLNETGSSSPEFLNVQLGRHYLSSFLSMSFEEVSIELGLLDKLSGLEQKILESLRTAVGRALELGLGYLSFDRKLRTLSSGEFQRVKLVSVLVEQVYGSLLTLDEPSSGLSPVDTKGLAMILSGITRQGNSVIVATHSKELKAASDEIVELQRDFKNPVKFQGSVEEYFKKAGEIVAPIIVKSAHTHFLNLSKVNLNNLVDLECQIPIGALTCLYGLSGSGKSTLALEVLLPLASRMIKERRAEVHLEFGTLSVPEQQIGRVVFFRAARFFSLRRAGVVSALGVVPAIRDLYLKTELARIRGLRARDLNFYDPTPEAAEIRFKGVAFKELRDLSILEGLELFNNIPVLKDKLKCAVDLGIGYLKLAQPLRTLSAGEEQRLNLASKVSLVGSTNTLFILDEPLNGLSDSEQVSVLEYLRDLVGRGHTIVAVDHSALMLKFSDCKIELGPGAGKNGGKVVSGQ